VSDSDPEVQVVGILGKDEREMNNGGNHPWPIEQGNDSTILLFNHGATSQPFYVLISSSGIQWQKTYTLESMQTEAISVRQLIADQTKDDSGKVLPRNGQSGQLGWWNQDTGLGKGRLLLSNRGNGMARNFSCSSLRGLCGIIYTSQITTFANGNTVIFATAIAMVCEIYAVNQCNGTADTGTGGYSTSWSSQNSAIASISGPSNQSSVSLYGAGVGSTNANVTISSPYCSRTGGGPARVTPKIRLGGASGTEITGTIQNVVVGQQILLYADYTLPSGQYANNQTWSVPGTRVGGFSTAPTNGGPTAISNNGQSTTYYWIVGANSQTATFTLNYGSNQTATAQATFNVSGVGSPSMKTLQYTALMTPTLTGCTGIPTGPWLVYGNVSGAAPGCGSLQGTPGVQFTPSGTQPSGGGTFVFAQLINSGSDAFTSSSGTTSCTWSTGLDTAFPYQNVLSGTAVDAPALQLLSTYSVETSVLSRKFLVFTL
jgi:hypothetical protein